jgi:hypothetical protein
LKGVGLRPRVLLLDRGFYGATTLQWLQTQPTPFVLPMIRRGRAGRSQATCTGTQRFFVRGRRGWDRYSWTARPRRHGRKQAALRVTVDVCMAPREPRRGRRKRGGPLVFVCGGIRRTPRALAALYRRRFRIETSYRQMREGLARTCSRNATFRLLLIGIALVLRNLWVWLHDGPLAHQAGHKQRRRSLARLRLRTLMHWIAHALDELLGQRLSVILPTTDPVNT